MAPNRIMRRARLRRAFFLSAATLAAAGSLVACGGGGATTTAVPDKEADVEVLNGVLARQLGVVAAYERNLPALHGEARQLARRFRAQEQEHVDAIVKALRGLGGEAVDEPEPIEEVGLDSEADRLVFLYELESSSIDNDLSAISELTAPWLRPLLASIAANQAQHLVLLRLALGAAADDLVPEAFEAGTTAAPSAMMAR